MLTLAAIVFPLFIGISLLYHGCPVCNIQRKQIKLNPFPNKPFVFMCLQYKSFENSVGKGEIAWNEKFLHFLQIFQTFQKAFQHFHQLQNCCLQTLSVWESLKSVIPKRVKKPEQTSIPCLF